MRVLGVDHLVLTVADIDRTCDFYRRVMGMEARPFGKGRMALHFGSQKINLHQADRPVDENVRHATPGSADLCLIVSGTSIESVMSEVNSLGVKIIEGIGRRTGALGPIDSFYFYDPDENLVELAVYPR